MPDTTVKIADLPLGTTIRNAAIEATQGGSSVRLPASLSALRAETWVISRSVSAPPASPAEDDRYLVGSGATGVWSGLDGRIVHWMLDGSGIGAWYSKAPAGIIYVVDEATIIIYSGSEWDSITDMFADMFDPLGAADAAKALSVQKSLNLSDLDDKAAALAVIGGAKASDIGALRDSTLISSGPVGSIANDPDATPTVRMRRLIGTSPTGAWVGKSNQVAEYFADGWHYSGEPSPSQIISVVDGKQYFFDGSVWRLWIQIALAERYMTIPGVLQSESGTDLTLFAQGTGSDVVLKWGPGGRASFGDQPGNFFIDYDTDPDFSGARFVTTHSGNVVCVRNASGAADSDSAIMFKDGLAGRNGTGTEMGAIGYHTGLNYPFENGFFIESSNDPILGVSDLAPAPLRLIHTGKLPGLDWGSRKRIELSSDGWTRFYDAQLNEDQVEVMRIPPKWPDDLVYIRGFKTSTGGDGHGYFGADASIVGELVRVAGASTWAMAINGKLGDTASNALFLTLGGDRSADGAYSVLNYVDGDGSGTQRAQILANGAFYGNGTYGTLSDKRLKHDRGPMGSVAKKFSKLDFHAYQMKSDLKAMGRRAPVRYGIFAQQAKPLFPHLIDEFRDSGKTRLRADYMALSVVAARALQETMAEVATLRREVRALKRA